MMNRLPFVAVLVLTATPALADPVKIKPIIDMRLRYETVDQVGIAREADALTMRIRAGAEAKSGDFAILAEAEGILALDESYNSGVNGKTAFPIIPDPETIGLNRLQLQYTGLPKTVVTVGRQRINLDDQRFVGGVGWRQNEQTFDAARVEWSGIKNVKADLTYSWGVRTIWGIDGVGNRPEAVSGDNVFANLSFKHKTGLLTGFAYLVDQDEAAVFGFRMSSKTFGARYSGLYPISKTVKLAVAASYARQGDYGRNPNNYSADYLLGEIGLDAKGFRLTGGYEVLGADKGAALTSFQTPLATLHKFNGWADRFLITPPNGLRDGYVSLGYTKPKVAGFDTISVLVAGHDYRSDRLDQRYGREVNLQIAAKLKRYGFLIKYADYTARGFATDTKKFWAQVEWAL
jgi:hypothetical protein